METIGHKQAKWPGEYCNLPDNTPYQYVDKSYMDEDDYDTYLSDPISFILKNVIPKKYNNLEGISLLNPYANCDHAISSFAVFANPTVRNALKTLLKVGEEIAEYQSGCTTLFESIISNGYPIYGLSPSCIPFDDFADNIRGLIDLYMDVISNPDEVDEALEKMGEVSIPAAIKRCKMMKSDNIFIPLHCGFDSFMSLENYEKHYWPGLKKLINAAIKENITPIVFCEGSYDTRLDCITDVPKGKVLYLFEKVDYAKAKEIIGPYAAIGGGLDTDILARATPEKVADETRRVIDILAPGGGFVMSNSTALDDIPATNMHAWRDTLEKYGYYH